MSGENYIQKGSNIEKQLTPSDEAILFLRYDYRGVNLLINFLKKNLTGNPSGPGVL